jgi:UDP-glucose 4-epimerase
MARNLITNEAGFIDSHLAGLLLNRGNTFSVIDNLFDRKVHEYCRA